MKDNGEYLKEEFLHYRISARILFLHFVCQRGQVGAQSVVHAGIPFECIFPGNDYPRTAKTVYEVKN